MVTPRSFSCVVSQIIVKPDNSTAVCVSQVPQEKSPHKRPKGDHIFRKRVLKGDQYNLKRRLLTTVRSRTVGTFQPIPGPPSLIYAANGSQIHIMEFICMSRYFYVFSETIN